MHIDSVVNHPFVQAILGDDRSLAGREMGSVRLCREIPRIVRPFQANGETIQLTLATTLPRYYSRNFTVRGTKGMYEEATDSVFIDRKEDRDHDFDWRKECSGNADTYAETYDHPIWKKFLEEGVQGSHGGMDWLEFEQFFQCLREDSPMPVDVYDAASWMAITALSEMSVARGGAVVDIPDFTNGKWAMGLDTAGER